MSRATIRAAVTDWLSSNSPGINTVYRGFPKVIPGQAFFSGPGSMSGCVAIIHIAGETETRIAVGGPTSGQKRVDYTLEIQLRYRSVKSASLNSDAGLEATDEFDATVDALKDRIRADRTAGSDAVWQWGEQELTGLYGELIESDNGLVQWGVIQTVVTEFLTT